ncbi:MAG: GNAT family N-acetyltransferase [Candidatus Acidiferrales bacterium]
MKFKLRDYNQEDFDTLHQIDQACYEPAIAYSRRELRNYLRFPGAICVLAVSRGKIAGFCLTEHKGEMGYFITIDVLAEYREKGAGSALVRESEKRLRGEGVREIGLETATDNETAIAFWQKHGYRNRGVKKNYYPGGRDAFVMAKDLTRP